MLLGIAPSKTLAKVANHLAKKQRTDFICELSSFEQQTQELMTLPIESIWGISSRLGRRLRATGFETALDLRESDVMLIRSRFGVVVGRIVYELSGQSCLGLEEVAAKKTL